ncbi:MAG: Tol-Pal system protein TolB [Chlamydiota bacterium]
MLKLFRLCALLVLAFGSCAAEEEIRIHLATNNPLTSIYVSRLYAEDSTFDAKYINALDVALQYNLNFNGLTKAVTRAQEKEEILIQKDVRSAFRIETWQNYGIPYIIKGVITGTTLNVIVFSTQNGSLKYFNDIVLTGQISTDKRQIHKLTDTIQKALFNIDGAANSRILYAVQQKTAKIDGGDWISEIWECDWDGSNTRQITRENSYSVTPVAIASKSDRFLYVSYKQGQPKIYIANTKEGSGKRLIDLRGNQLLPAVSLKRDKIAFICDAGGRTDLFVQAFHPDKGEIGKPVQLFSYPRSTQASPTFNPDGSKIAFVSDKDGLPRIYIIPTSTSSSRRSHPVLLTKQNNESTCPAWSPNGKKIAYSSKTNGVRQIWIYDFDTRTEKQLTFGPGNKENPAWSPNSTHIVFNSTDAASSELYVVNLNQPEAIKITKGPGKKHYPTWATN